MTMQKFSICIPTHRFDTRLENTLEALTNSIDYPKDLYEIVLLLDRIEVPTSFNTSGIKVYYSRSTDKDISVSNAKNQALSKGTNDWIVLVDSDDFLVPSSLKQYNHYINNIQIDDFYVGFELPHILLFDTADGASISSYDNVSRAEYYKLNRYDNLKNSDFINLNVKGRPTLFRKDSGYINFDTDYNYAEEKKLLYDNILSNKAIHLMPTCSYVFNSNDFGIAKGIKYKDVPYAVKDKDILQEILEPLVNSEVWSPKFICKWNLKQDLTANDALFLDKLLKEEKNLRLNKKVMEEVSQPTIARKNVSIVCEGNLADQICAEPTCRYIIDELHSKDNVSIVSSWPEIFDHLNVPIYTIQKIKPDIAYHTLRDPKSPSSDNIDRRLIDPILFSSLQAIKGQLPIKYNKVSLFKPNKRDLNKLLIKHFKDKDIVDRLILFHPGKSLPEKTFPITFWQGWLDTLVNNGYTVAVIGKHQNSNNTLHDLKENKSYNLVDKLSLKEMLTLISYSAAIITNDSYMFHLAATTKTPIGLIATYRHPDYIIPDNKVGSVTCLERIKYYKGPLNEDSLPKDEEVLNYIRSLKI